MINLKFDPEGIKRAALAILKGAAVKVIKFVASLGRGKTPWVYYETKEGKRRSTFLKKSDFSGYVWNENFSEVINLETGDIYKVNDNSCSCQDWYYRVRTGKKPQCKHQAMREEFIIKKKISLETLRIKEKPHEINRSFDPITTACFPSSHQSKNLKRQSN